MLSTKPVITDPNGNTRVLDRIFLQKRRQLQAMFPAAAVITPDAALTPDQQRAVDRGYRYWFRPPILDQGNEGACTGFGATSVINAGPVRPHTLLVAADAQRIYHRARQLDEFPGEADEGSSVDGAMLACREFGYVKSFRWIRELQTAVRALLTEGPLDLGIDFTEGMMKPDAVGFIRPTGAVVGGHSLAIVGGDVKKDFRDIVDGKMYRGFVLLAQSWGVDYGPLGGFVKLAVEHLAKLIDGIESPGDVCIAAEK